MPKVVFEITLTVVADPADFNIEWDVASEDAVIRELAEKVREMIEDELAELEPDVDKVELEDIEYSDEEYEYLYAEDDFDEDDCDDEDCDDWEDWEEEDDDWGDDEEEEW